MRLLPKTSQGTEFDNIRYLIIFQLITLQWQYGNTGCWVFKWEIQNWKDFCMRIIIPKWNYWILSFGLTTSCQKVANFDFRSQFFMSKIILIILKFFFVEEYQFRSTFLLLIFFDHFIIKMMPYSWQLIINPKLKIQ